MLIPHLSRIRDVCSVPILLFGLNQTRQLSETQYSIALRRNFTVGDETLERRHASCNKVAWGDRNSYTGESFGMSHWDSGAAFLRRENLKFVVPCVEVPRLPLLGTAPALILEKISRDLRQRDQDRPSGFIFV